MQMLITNMFFVLLGITFIAKELVYSYEAVLNVLSKLPQVRENNNQPQ